jgi:hypothetical protein
MKEEVEAEIHEQELVALSRLFKRFLIGVGSIVSLWFLIGLLYVIFR